MTLNNLRPYRFLLGTNGNSSLDAPHFPLSSPDGEWGRVKIGCGNQQTTVYTLFTMFANISKVET
jgi:hypothetical protein